MSISNTTFHPSRVEDRIYDLMEQEEYTAGIDLYTESLLNAVHNMIIKEFPEVEYETFAVRSLRGAGIYIQSFAWVEDGHIHLIGWDFEEDDE